MLPECDLVDLNVTSNEVKNNQIILSMSRDVNTVEPSIFKKH